MEWYEQPMKLQKYFILMVANTQKSVYYRGFDIATLNLETFIQVKSFILQINFISFTAFNLKNTHLFQLCNSVYSYYMMIKTLAAN